MADTQETIADIIAEMRFHAQQNIDAEKDKPEYGFLTVEGRIAQNYADRLEAAHKHECGDAANTRRARKARLAISMDAQRKEATMDANIKTTQDALEWLDRSIREEVELDGETSNTHAIQLGFIQNMLAKFPRRNCDVYDSYGDAIRAFEDDENAEGYEDMAEWLYAPATEKEGGAK